MKTEWEIEKTKDFILGLDAEQKKIALEILLEEKGVSLEELQKLLCDKGCYWAQECTNRERLAGF